MSANDNGSGEGRGYVVIAYAERDGAAQPDLRAMWAKSEEMGATLAAALRALGWKHTFVVEAFRKEAA